MLSGISAVSARAQSRDEIRQQNQQLYQQYQQSPADQSGGQSSGYQSGNPSAPPMDGDTSGSDATPQYSAPAASSRHGGNLMAQLVDRVARLEDDNRALSGRVDELERNLQTQNATLTKQIGDLSFAVQQGGHAVAAPASGGNIPAPAEPRSAPASTSVPPAARATAMPRTPEAALRQGNVALGRRDYEGAADAARAALASGGTAHAASAEYLLAQSYAGQRNYQQAAVAYYDAYNRQPHGALAQDALLHVGSSMIALNQNGAACEALSKLRAEFPSARPGVVRAGAQLRARAHC